MIARLLLSCLIVFNCYAIVGFCKTTSSAHIQFAQDKLVESLVGTFRIGASVANAIATASLFYGIDPYLVGVLFKTESNFKSNVVSPKGYRGIPQIPFNTGHDSSDIFVGVSILNQKLKASNGNMLEALARYKGGLNQMAFSQARQVLEQYKKLEVM